MTKSAGKTHGGVLILVKLQAEACNFTEINTPPWVFFAFFKLYKWYQIAQRTRYLTYLLIILNTLSYVFSCTASDTIRL